MICRVSMAFARFVDSELDGFAQVVVNEMTGNADYPSPPVTMAALQTASDDFTAKVGAAKMGGRLATAEKQNSREGLIFSLRQLAGYVQLHCQNDMTKLLGSGFQAASTNLAQTALEQPQSLTIKNGNTGQLIASVAKVKNKSIYEGRIKEPEGVWRPSVFSRDSRRIVFDGLTRGTDYTIQVRALGGATGQSDWSDASSHMSM